MTVESVKKKPDEYMLGSKRVPTTRDFSDEPAWDDYKIKFCVKYATEKDVLDIGCVHHNPENYRSRYWLHKALVKVGKSVEGLDLYDEGVRYLNNLGYNIHTADAQDFDLGRTYDVIVAGDLIEHLNCVGDFLECCRRHLRPDGKLLISTPNPWYWRNVVKAALRGRVRPNAEHTLWMCPDTLRQIADRYSFRVRDVIFGSRYMKDRLVPLPQGVRHTSFCAALERQDW